jgi:hypothetical protein
LDGKKGGGGGWMERVVYCNEMFSFNMGANIVSGEFM